MPKFCTEISEIWPLDANSNSCQAPKCFRHHVWMFAECRGLKSRVMVLESIQSFVNTALQPDTMPGVKSLFTAEVNEAVILQMTCEEMIVVSCGASLLCCCIQPCLIFVLPDLLPNYGTTPKDPHWKQFVISYHVEYNTTFIITAHCLWVKMGMQNSSFMKTDFFSPLNLLILRHVSCSSVPAFWQDFQS